jgi:predicted P-loop ATPase
MTGIVQLREPGAEARADAETERKRALFDWADSILQQIGVAEKVAQAQSIDDLHKITIDLNDAEVEIAIRDALHPIVGVRAPHFVGMRAGALKQVLKTRFNQMKKDRAAEMLRRAGATGGQHASYTWTNDLKLDADGGVRPILTNLILFLRHHQAWNDVLAFDEFHLRVVVRMRPPWGNEPPDAPLVDHHETLIRTWLESEDIIAAQDKIGRAIQAAARFNRFHPGQDYLNALAPTWDGKSRIDTWLIVYLSAKDMPYIRAIGPRILISAVARMLTPGCKVDTMPVLEAPQGQGKSTSLRILFAPWFTDRLSALTTKDAAQEMGGIWGIEAAEMEAINKATTGATKSFISRQSDRYRPPYGKHLIDQPRQSVLLGTINPPVGGYLKDPTGSRRIWPFGSGVINLETLAHDRDQLWAEAVVRYRAGDKWWLPPELEVLAATEQALRFKADVWEEPIREWLGDRDDTSIREILEHVLGCDPSKPNYAAGLRVQKILTGRLYFRKYRPRRGDGRENRYAREKLATRGVTGVTERPESDG